MISRSIRYPLLTHNLVLLQKRSFERLPQARKGLKTLNYTQKQTKRNNRVFLHCSAKTWVQRIQNLAGSVSSSPLKPALLTPGYYVLPLLAISHLKLKLTEVTFY